MAQATHNLLSVTVDRGRPRLRSAFTLIELIVVVTIIALILAIAVPGLSAANLENRFSAATQAVNSVLSRAAMTAASESNMIAVRFLPAAWDVDERGEPQRRSGAQHLATYRYVGSADRETRANTWVVEFAERFEPAEKSISLALPTDVWAAPLEARSGENLLLSGAPAGGGNTLGADVLGGQIGGFCVDAGLRGTGQGQGGNYTTPLNFLNADDFLIVFDGQSGLRAGFPKPYRLKAYNPVQNLETDMVGTEYISRFAFSGVTLYRRDPFVTLGTNAQGIDRRAWMSRAGRPYLIHRYSGGLVMGSRQAP